MNIHGSLDKAATPTNKCRISIPYKKTLMCLTFIFITVLKYLPNIISYPSLYIYYVGYMLFTCISLIPICMYNGKKGPKVKYLFYAFYPMHLLLLYFLNFALQIM